MRATSRRAIQPKKAKASRKNKKKAMPSKQTKKNTNSKKNKKAKASRKKTKRDNKSKRRDRRGGGPDDIFEPGQIMNMTNAQLFSHLSNDNKRTYNKDHKNSSRTLQNAHLMNMVVAQSASNAALKKYRDDTSKYMVYERGKMPYDSRLTEDTVHDEHKKVVEPLKQIHIFSVEPTSTKPERLKKKFQTEWRAKGLEHMNVDRVNDMIRNANANRIHKSYPKSLYNQYDDAFRAFLNDDPEYVKAYADYIKEFHDREKMWIADRETQVIEAPERAVKAAAARARVREEEDEKRKTERAIRKKEEVYPDRIPWTAVKRRSLEYDESREKPGQYYASMHLLNGHRDPIIRFASAAEVAEAMALRKFNIAPRILTQAAAAATTNDAYAIIHKYNMTIDKYGDSIFDDLIIDKNKDPNNPSDYPDRITPKLPHMLKSEAIKCRSLNIIKSNSNPDMEYVRMPSGLAIWLIKDVEDPVIEPPKVPEESRAEKLRNRLRAKAKAQAQAQSQKNNGNEKAP